MALGKPVGIGRQKEIELDTAASHLIEECRMVIPGIQALFGFQLIAIFNQGFDEKLPSMALVMTPAAIHRIAEPMSVSERFLWMASKLLLAGMVSLAIGVALDVFVFTTALSSSHAIGVALGIGALLVFFVFWLVVPRRERDRYR